MTRGLKWTGLVATAVIAALVVLNIVREPERRQQAQADYHETAVASGIDLYANHCARCHGAAGEGLGVYRALNQQFIVNKDAQDLGTVIRYGRYATDMAAFGLDEGGSLTPMQINEVVLMLQAGRWEVVQARVEALGMTPSEDDIMAAQRASHPVTVAQQAFNTETLANTLPLFAEHCAKCHGEQGQGTADAPQLNNAYVRGMSTSQLSGIVGFGVRNTKMEGFNGRLSEAAIVELITLLQNWYRLDGQDEVQVGSVLASEAEIAAVTETGSQLFEMWCAVCHGAQGEGGAIAPSLNDIPQLPLDFVVSRIRSGQNAMPPFAETDLSNGQLALVITYAQEHIIGAGLPTFSTAEIAQGQALYKLHCAECHGESGEGTANAGPQINTLPPMRASEIINFTRVGSLQTPAISSSIVSDQELRLIVGYLHSLNK